MRIRIVTDSAADLELWEQEQYGVECVPLQVHFGDVSYQDDGKFPKDAFYQKLTTDKHSPSTSQPSPEEFKALFQDAAAHGDEVVVITLAEVLSGTYQSANIGKEMAGYGPVYLVNSCTASVGQKMLVLRAAQLRDQGMPAQEIADAIEELKHRVKLYFCIDTLEYLRRGGRLSAAAAGIGTLARVKPILSLGDQGQVQMVAKCMGRRKAMDTLCKLLQGEALDPEIPPCGVYSADDAHCLELLERLRRGGVDCPDNVRSNMGPVIGTHVGPGAFGAAIAVARPEEH